MSRDGCMGRANSLEIGRTDYWTTKKSAAKALLISHGRGRSERERNRLAAFGRIHDSHRPLLAFRQMRNARRAEDGDMDEHVLAAVVAGDEAEPFGVVEPLDLADDRDPGRRVRRNPG